MILAERLVSAGFDPSRTLCHRIALDPADADDGFLTIADLLRSGHALIYQRLQEGRVFGDRATVVAMLALTAEKARVAAVRTLLARAPGSAPGDIVYDPAIAHLLHNFIARTHAPTFYDASDDNRGSPLIDLVMRWPETNLCRGDDPRLTIFEGD